MDRNKTHRPVCKKTSGKTVCAPAQREAQKEEREMKKGKVHIIFGTGMGKTAMALGRGVSAAMHGRKVIMIQFLKGVLSHETADGLKQLEPAFKVFRFEKQNEYYENLSEEGKKEELCNIQNGYNFAKKVLCTGECDMLILDEFLGVLDQKLVGDDALETLLAAREENVDLILTGKVCPAGVEEHADEVTRLECLKPLNDHACMNG